MSAQGEIHGFLATLAKGQEGQVVPVTPDEIARQTGHSRNRVNKTLFNLQHTGKLQLAKGPNGRNIIGYTLFEGPRERRGRPAGTGRRRLSEPAVLTGRTRRRSLMTPSLDEYADAKARFESMRDQFGELVEANFKENQYAEEGLLLRERLDSIEAQWSDMRAQLEEAQRDLRYLRGKLTTQQLESAMSEGALVTHAEN